MSDSNWRNTFISGMIIGGFLLFIAIQLYPNGIYDQSSEEKACIEQQKSDAFLGPFLVHDEKESLTGIQGGEEARNGPDPKYDYCDLVAQQRAASAAQGAERASWVTTGLTGLGVLLLWWTLQATRQTLREAEATTVTAIAGTKAAEETTKITLAQAVAYPTIDKLSIELREGKGDPYRLIIKSDWRNTGSTPAFDFGAKYHLIVKTGDQAVIDRVLDTNLERGLVQLAPGQCDTLYSSPDDFSFGDYVDAMRQGRLSIGLEVKGSFRNAFGKLTVVRALYRSSAIYCHENKQGFGAPYIFDIKMAKCAEKED